MSSSLLLIAASFVLPMIWWRYRDGNVPLWPYLCVVVVLNAVSLANAWYGPLPGAEWDAKTFHDRAANKVVAPEWPPISIGTQLYVYMLYLAYLVLGADLLVGQTLSILAGVASLMLVAVLATRLGVENRTILSWMVIVAGLYPTFVFHSALTFREPYQMTALVTGVFFVFKACRENAFIWLLPAAVAFLVMGLLHHVMLVVCFLLIAMAALFVHFSRPRNGARHLLLAAGILSVCAAGYLVAVSVPASGENDYLEEVQKEGGLLNAIVEYRKELDGREPRTSFEVEIQGTGAADVVAGFARNYAAYLFKPYFSDVDHRVDVVAFAASLGRILCLLMIAGFLVSGRRIDARVAFVLVSYLLITFVWSLGTTNYGQAFRHHAMTDWMLVLVAGYVVSRVLTGRRARTGERPAARP